MDREAEPGLTRVPDENDLVKLARELNRLGVAYVVLKMKQGRRDKDKADRSFLQQLIKNSGSRPG